MTHVNIQVLCPVFHDSDSTFIPILNTIKHEAKQAEIGPLILYKKINENYVVD